MRNTFADYRDWSLAEFVRASIGVFLLLLLTGVLTSACTAVILGWFVWAGVMVFFSVAR